MNSYVEEKAGRDKRPLGSHGIAGRKMYMYAFVFFNCFRDSTCLHRSKRIGKKKIKKK